MKNFLFIFLHLAFSLTGFAQQQWRFQNFDTRDGLSHHHVNCLLKDSKGFLWIGTEFGLNRFDGVEFEKWFHIPGDTASLLYNKINNLAEDQQHQLWIATDKGISIYNFQSGSFTSYHSINTKNSGDIELEHSGVFCDADGDVWIGSSSGSVLLFQSATKTFFNISLELSLPGRMQNNYVGGFLQDHKNRIWVATSYGIYKLDKINLRATSYRKNETHKNGSLMNTGTGLFETQGGLILCGTWNAGFLIYDEQQDVFNPFYSMDGPFLPNPVVFNFRQYDSIVFFTTLGGLYTCAESDLATKGFKAYNKIIPDPNEPNSIASEFTNSIVTDSLGNLWAGGDQGLSMLSKTSKYFKTFSLDEILPFRNGIPISLEQHGDRLLVAVNNEVLFFYVEEEKFEQTRVEISDIGFHRFKKSRNHYYQPSKSNVLVYDENFKLLKTIQEKHPNGEGINVYDAMEDREGNIWTVTSRYGLRKHERNGQVVSFLHDSTQVTHSVGDIIFGIEEGTSGTIYAGGKTLFVLQPSQDRFTSKSIFRHSTDNEIRAIKMVNDHLWIGSKNGLFSYDEMNERITQHPIPAEINNYIEEIEVDNQGNIWMITSSGLLKYNPDDSSTMLFNDKTGWPRTFTAIRRLEDGRMAAGGIGEIVIIDPAEIKPETYSPQPLITRLVIDEDSTFLFPFQDILFRLRYNQSIRFNFISLTHQHAANNKYAWKLSGLDDHWHPIANATTQSFTTLAPGEYTFSVMSSNASDVWSQPSEEIKFKVMPPFYRASWFIGMLTLFLGGIIYLFYRYRLQKAIQIEKMRTQIATDLHDDIGATLSSISFYSEAVRQKTRHTLPEVSSILEKMGETSRAMVGNMSDIVWAIDPQHDDLSKMVERMQSYAREICALRSIKLQIAIDDRIHSLKPNLAQRRNIYLIFKEALNNALKYSDGQVIQLSVEWNGNVFHLHLTDDGKGFNTAVDADGNGIKNMQKRAEEIGGPLYINSRIGSGTTVDLSVTI